MKKSVIALLGICVLTLALSGCVATTGSGTVSEAGLKSHTVTVSTGEFHEFCDVWDVGDTVDFSFTSTQPVVFNIHYHTADHKKHYPVKDTSVAEYSGSFVVQTGDVHCGSWQNNNDNFIKMTYEMGVAKK